MFDMGDGEGLAGADAAALVAVIAGAARAEAVAAGARAAAIGVLLARNEAAHDPRWVFDGFTATAAEVGAAMGLSPRRAAGLVRTAAALRDRLPRIGELLGRGVVSERVASVMCWRTGLVDGPDAAAAIDGELAALAVTAGVLSDRDLEQGIDAAISRHDPDARRRVHTSARYRDIQFGKPDDQAGVRSVFGAVTVDDGDFLEATLQALVATVCRRDPRTNGERRSDALRVAVAGGQVLPCRCHRPDCPQAVGAVTGADGGVVDRSRAHVVIHVLADREAIEAAIREAATQADLGTPWLAARHRVAAAHASAPGGAGCGSRSQRRAAAREQRRHARPRNAGFCPAPAATTRTATTRTAAPAAGPAGPEGRAVLFGGGTVPGPLLAEMVRTGAKITALKAPGPDPEPQYRPSTALAWFVRARDLRCRFPGCNRPAEYCDIDHVDPYPHGLTHPGNTACLCRLHHIAKTHHGWVLRLDADGAVTVTSPHGQSYRSPPPTALVFPRWNITTPLPPAAGPAAGQGSGQGAGQVAGGGSQQAPAAGATGAGIPRRSRTRAAERAWRIQAERDDNHVVNAAYDAELERALGPRSGVPTAARAAAPSPAGGPRSELIPDAPPPF